MQVDYKQFADPHSNKWWIVAGVLIFQALVLVAIQMGMGQRFMRIVQTPIEAELIQAQKPKIDPPKPPPVDKPPPKTVVKPDYVPPVEVPHVATPNNAIAQFSSTPQAPSPKAAEAPPAPPPPPPAPVVRTPAVINASSSCETPEYPSQSRRLQESGTVQLRFYVGADGRVIESSVEKSSGYRRLDEAARLALAKCQFKPGTVDGKPEPSWANLRYVWKLEE
jgi:protein TonB